MDSFLEIDPVKLIFKVNNQEYYLRGNTSHLIHFNPDRLNICESMDIHSDQDLIYKCHHAQLYDLIVIYVPEKWLTGTLITHLHTTESNSDSKVTYILYRIKSGFTLLKTIRSSIKLSIKDLIPDNDFDKSNDTNALLFYFIKTDNSCLNFLTRMLIEMLNLNYIIIENDLKYENLELGLTYIVIKLPDSLNDIYVKPNFIQTVTEILKIMQDNTVLTIQNTKFTERLNLKDFKKVTNVLNLNCISLTILKNLTVYPAKYYLNYLLLSRIKSESFLDLPFPVIHINPDLILNYQDLRYFNHNTENSTWTNDSTKADYHLITECPVYLKHDTIERLLNYTHDHIICQGSYISKDEKYLNKKLDWITNLVMRTETENIDKPLLTFKKTNSNERPYKISDSLVWGVR